jgi:hypothetical protein
MKPWKTYEEAKKYVHALGLSSRPKWRAWCKAGNKPNDIPSGPDLVYPEFAGWGDWLGTGTVAPWNKQYRSFEDAKTFVRSLKLNTIREWFAFCRDGATIGAEDGSCRLLTRPTDIPTQPARVYKAEWKDWGDWLGCKARKHNRKRRPYKATKRFVRKLGIKSVNEWRAYCKVCEKPKDIPRCINTVYREFTNWNDFFNIKKSKRFVRHQKEGIMTGKEYYTEDVKK